MPRPALPILRPLVLALALPFAAVACISALGSSGGSAPSAAAASAAAQGPFAYVSNEGSGDLTVIDTARDEVVGTVKVGKRPRGIRLDARGERVFVALSGSPRQPPGISPAVLEPPDRSADGIGVVEVASRTLVAILPSGQDPGAFDLLPDGETLVVSSAETAAASVVDIAGGRIVASVTLGEEPEGVTTAPGGALVAVTSVSDHRVDFVDPAARAVVARVPTCLRPRTVVFTPDGALAFATCEEGAALQVIDARALRPAGEIALPPGSRPMGAAISADGSRLFVSNGHARTVSVIDVASRTVTATAQGVGARCWGIALTPDGRKLYVANGPSDDVAVLDVATLAVVKRIPAGKLPWGVAMGR
jgi:YVTN family beta-propeller protein